MSVTAPTRVRRRRAFGVGGAVAALLAGVTACGGGGAPTIDGARIEAKIKSEASAGGGTIDRVSCPAGRAAKANESFQCTATGAGGATFTYDVVIGSEKGDYTYRLAPNQTLDGESVAREVTADIAATGPDFAAVSVTCPKQLLAPTGTATADCALTLGDHTTPLVVTKMPGQPPQWAFRK